MLETLLGCAGLPVLLEDSDGGCVESVVVPAALWLKPLLLVPLVPAVGNSADPGAWSASGAAGKC